MLDRTTHPNHKYYARYGGSGILPTEAWRDFRNFLADMGACPEGYSLDRIDNEKGYFKENCRWIPLRDQPKNRRVCKKPYVPPYQMT